MVMNTTMNRRQVLAAAGLGAGALCLPRFARAQDADQRFLIVLAATGGASIIDAMLAVRESESANASIMNTYPDGMVTDIDGTPFRAIDQRLDGIGPLPYSGLVNQSNFVRRHAQNMMVVTHTGTSVNHIIAQKRSLTGNDAWAGRTLPEAVAAKYGLGMPLPNVNMAVGGYLEPGIDPSLPPEAIASVVTDPRLLFAGLDGSRGIERAPEKALLNIAREYRDGRLDVESTFAKTFKNSSALALWKSQRANGRRIEAANLITKLNMLPDTPATPLSRYGLDSTADTVRLRQVFPLFFEDPLESKAALAYLLLKNRVSATVTIGPSLAPLVNVTQPVDSPPLAFDFSHSSHRGAQGLMWHRILSVADRLIGLLEEIEYSPGVSFWEQTMIYVATDFGRSKRRPADAPDFGTGHHINNGSLIISPLVNGNSVLGGVNGDTLETYGFNPNTGAAAPGRSMSEGEIYSGLLGALNIEPEGANLLSVPVMSR